MATLGRERADLPLPPRHQRGSHQVVRGLRGGWTPCQARGSVWDSQLAPSQGHRSGLVVGRRVSKNQAAPGLAVGVERLLAVGGSKGLGHTAGRERPWDMPGQEKAAWSPAGPPDHAELDRLEVAGSSSALCPDSHENSSWLWLSRTFQTPWRQQLCRPEAPLP